MSTLNIQDGNPKLQDEDAGLIGRSWFSTGKKTTVGRISE